MNEKLDCDQNCLETNVKPDRLLQSENKTNIAFIA